jgi:hypothetical protein
LPVAGAGSKNALKETKDTDVRVRNVSFVALSGWRGADIGGTTWNVGVAIIPQGRSWPDLIGKDFLFAD